MDIRKMIGKEIEGKYGIFTITGIIDNSKKTTRYEVEFKKTKHKMFAMAKTIKSGIVKDPYFENVQFVAKSGIWEKTKENKHFKSIWSGMIARCYNKKHEAYIRYGAKGVYVTEEWLCFENFLNDAKYIEGFNQEKFDNSELELDKDIKKLGYYSKESCKWVSFQENNKGKINEKTFYVDGKETNGLRLFCKENNLPFTSVQRAIKQNKLYRGFQFNESN